MVSEPKFDSKSGCGQCGENGERTKWLRGHISDLRVQRTYVQDAIEAFDGGSPIDARRFLQLALDSVSADHRCAPPPAETAMGDHFTCPVCMVEHQLQLGRWVVIAPSKCLHGVALTQACMTCISRGDDPRGPGFRPRTSEAETDGEARVISTPGVLGGAWRIEGTRIAVDAVQALAKAGCGVDRIGDMYPHLSLEQINVALAFEIPGVPDELCLMCSAPMRHSSKFCSERCFTAYQTVEPRTNVAPPAYVGGGAYSVAGSPSIVDALHDPCTNEAVHTCKATPPGSSCEGCRVEIAAECAADVLTINMQSQRPKQRGDHVHGCPECHEAVPCNEVCSIEYDLGLRGGLPCGAYVVCDPCTGQPLVRADGLAMHGCACLWKGSNEEARSTLKPCEMHRRWAEDAYSQGLKDGPKLDADAQRSDYPRIETEEPLPEGFVRCLYCREPCGTGRWSEPHTDEHCFENLKEMVEASRAKPQRSETALSHPVSVPASTTCPNGHRIGPYDANCDHECIGK